MHPRVHMHILIQIFPLNTKNGGEERTGIPKGLEDCLLSFFLFFFY